MIEKLHIPDPEVAKRLHSQGMSFSDIAREMGVCHKTAKCLALGLRPSRGDSASQRVLQYESRWDLLDTNSVEKLVESAEPLQVPEER